MLLTNSNSTSYTFTFPQTRQPNSSTFSAPMRAIHKAPATTLPQPPSWPFSAPLMSFPRHRCLACFFVSVASRRCSATAMGFALGLLARALAHLLSSSLSDVAGTGVEIVGPTLPRWWLWVRLRRSAVGAGLAVDDVCVLSRKRYLGFSSLVSDPISGTI